MKKALLCLFVLAISGSPAFAAPKTIQVKKIEILASANSAEGLVVSGKNIVTFSNTASPNSNVVVTALDAVGTTQWTRTIDSGSDEIASAASADSLGNIWLAGSSAPILPIETATTMTGVENPDGVEQSQLPRLRPDMIQVTLWKLSSAGELLATYNSVQEVPALINSLSVNTSGVSVVGQLNGRPFLINASTIGEFGKTIFIGTEKTQANVVIRAADGSVNVFGSSTEKLMSKNLAGNQDGFLMKLNKSGVTTSVVRSSAPKSNRGWLSADPTLTLTGYVKVGKVTESAVTKFNSSFTPVWTIRVPSLGKSQVVVGSNTTYAAINSIGSIKGVAGWKPTTPSLLLLTFDNKGVISGGFGSSDLAVPIALGFSRDLGVIGLAAASDKSISIFRVGTR